MNWIFLQTLRGSFSAVSTPIFASKYSLESSWRDLQDLHTFAPLRSQNFSQKSSTFFREWINEFPIFHFFGEFRFVLRPSWLGAVSWMWRTHKNDTRTDMCNQRNTRQKHCKLPRATIFAMPWTVACLWPETLQRQRWSFTFFSFSFWSFDWFSQLTNIL